MKLTKSQQDVVDRMQRGWILWSSHFGIFLKENRVNGQSRKVRHQTFAALAARGVIVRNPVSILVGKSQWILTKLGGAQ